MCKQHNPRKIDKCMKNFVKRMEETFRRLNGYNKKYNSKLEITIKASCCGHLRYPMTLVVSCKEQLNSYDKEKSETFSDWISGKAIPRKRKFYKKDKQGFYYIPEVVNVSQKRKN